jgi:membrane protein YqaA with SNARE-associated domain
MALRDTLKSWAHGPWLYPVVFLIGVLEASFVLVPMEPLLIPMMAGRGRRVWLIATVVIAGNLVAALIMYVLGANFSDVAIDPFVRLMGAEESYQRMLTTLREEGFWALVMIDLTPVPFQVAMAAAGAAAFPFGLFMLATLIARGARYYLLAGLVLLIGARAQRWIERHEVEIFVGGLALFAVTAVVMVLI